MQLGTRLRRQRLLKGDTQARFADRMQVSVPTLSAMERGEPTVAVGYWMSAIWVLDRLDEVSSLLAPPRDLRVRMDEERRLGRRQRARTSRRKRAGEK